MQDWRVFAELVDTAIVRIPTRLGFSVKAGPDSVSPDPPLAGMKSGAPASRHTPQGVGGGLVGTEPGSLCGL